MAGVTCRQRHAIPNLSPKRPVKFSSLSNQVIGHAITVHRRLGPGLLESTYAACLAQELRQAGLRVRTEVYVSLEYKGLTVENAYRIDQLIEESLILELKSVDKMTSLHRSKVLTYMRLSPWKEGLLINFNVERLTDGIRGFALSGER